MIPHAEDPEGERHEHEQPGRHEHRDDVDGQRRQRRQREDELWRVDVPLLLLENRVVQLRIRRTSVEHGLGRRQIGEADIPGKQVLREAEADERERPHDGDEDESGGENAGSRPSTIVGGPRHRSLGGRLHPP